MRVCPPDRLTIGSAAFAQFTRVPNTQTHTPLNAQHGLQHSVSMRCVRCGLITTRMLAANLPTFTVARLTYAVSTAPVPLTRVYQSQIRNSLSTLVRKADLTLDTVSV